MVRATLRDERENYALCLQNPSRKEIYDMTTWFIKRDKDGFKPKELRSVLCILR